MSPPSSLTSFLLVVILVSIASADSIGVNYGSVADNLPPPPKVATFVRDNSISDYYKNFIGGVCTGVGMWIGQRFCNPSQPLSSPQSPMLPPSPIPSPMPSMSPSLPSPATGMIFCVAKNGASEQALQSNIDYACGSGGVDCGPIQSGGPCFDPDTIQSHATYVMNAYYQKSSGQNSACDFSGTGVLVTDDPSYGRCKYST